MPTPSAEEFLGTTPSAEDFLGSPEGPPPEEQGPGPLSAKFGEVPKEPVPYTAPNLHEEAVLRQPTLGERLSAAEGPVGVAKELLDVPLRPVRERLLQNASELAAAQQTASAWERNAYIPFVRSLEETTAGMLTPENAAIFGGAALTGGLPAAAEGLSTFFATVMGKQAIEKVPEAYQAYKEGNYPEAVKSLFDAGFTGAFAVGAGKHAAGLEGRLASGEKATQAQAENATFQAAGSHVNFVEPTPLSTEDINARKAAAEASEAEWQKRKADALSILQANLPEGEEVPDAPPESLRDRWSPTEAELAEIGRKGSYGPIAQDDLPKSVLDKASLGIAVDRFEMRLTNAERPGRIQDPLDVSKWSGIKSAVPQVLQNKAGGAAWQLEVLRKGFAGEHMTLTERDQFRRQLDYLEAEGRRIYPNGPPSALLESYFKEHGIEAPLQSAKEAVDAEKLQQEEREGIKAEPEAETTFDPAELESVEPAGVSDVRAIGRDGEALNPLMPPDTPLRQAVADQFAASRDPSGMAQFVASLYDIKEPIKVTVDPTADVPRTELTNGALSITLPQGWEPYQLVHEVMYEGRKLTGHLLEDLPHDDNIIAARFLGDMRAAGFVKLRPDGLPETGFLTGEHPLAPASGRTFDLDRAFAPSEGTVQTPLPNPKNIYDPAGLMDPENKLRYQEEDFQRRIEAGNQIDQNSDLAGTELFHKALQDWQADYLRRKGFDAYIWKDEGFGRHLTMIPREKFVPGGAQADETGQPYDGAPDAEAIASDHAELEAAAARIQEPAAMELHVEIPLVKPFFENTLGPTLKAGKEAVTEFFSKLAMALHPTSFVPDKYLDSVMEGLRIKNRAMATFRLNVAIRQARSLFDQLSEDEQTKFIDDFKTGQFGPSNRILSTNYFKEDVGTRLLPEFAGGTPTKMSLNEIGRMMYELERGWYDMLADEMDKNGQSMPFRDNHLALFWKDRKAGDAFVARYLSKRPLEGTKGALRQMVYDTMSEGIAAGLEPVSRNPFRLMELRLNDNMRFISAREMFRNLKDGGAVTFVRAGGDYKFKNDHPGWIPLPDKISQVYYPTEVATGQPTGVSTPQTMAVGVQPPRTVFVRAGTYYWEPNVARIMNNYLSTDFVRNMKAGRGMLAFKNITTAVELSLATFHLGYTNMTATASAIGDGLRMALHGDSLKTQAVGASKMALNAFLMPVGWAVGGIPAAVEGSKWMRYFKNKDEFLATTAGRDFMQKYPNADAMVDRLFEGGGTVGMSESYREESVRGMAEGFQKGDWIGNALRTIPYVLQTVSAPLFDQYIPRVKLGNFMKELSTELMVNQDRLARGDVSEATLARRVWASQDNKFGELNFDNLFWNRSMKSGLQLALRSVTWKLGNIRQLAVGLGRGLAVELGDPLMAVAKNLMMDATGKQGPRNLVKSPKLDGDMAFLLGTALGTVTAGTVAQWAMSGKLPRDTDTPLQDMVMPRTGDLDQWGNPARMMVPSYVRDWLAMGTHPAAYAEHSLAGIWNRAYEAYNNKDFYGNFVYDPNDPKTKKVLEFAWHLFPRPIVGQSFGQALETAGSGPAMAASPFGWTPAPAAYSQSEFQNYIMDTRRAQAKGAPGRTEQQAKEREARKQIEEADRLGIPEPEEAVDTAGKAGTTRARRLGEAAADFGVVAAQASNLNLEQLATGIIEHATPKEAIAVEQVLVHKHNSGKYLRRRSGEDYDRITSLVDQAFQKIEAAKGGAPNM